MTTVCWCGTQFTPAPATPLNLAVIMARCGRWRCCLTGRWSPAGTTGWCCCGTQLIPHTGPAALGRHDAWVVAAAVLTGGQVVTGGDYGRVLVWDRARAGTPVVQLSCSVTALATVQLGPANSKPAKLPNKGSGFSLWSFAG